MITSAIKTKPMLKHKPEGWYDETHEGDFSKFGQLGGRASAKVKQAHRAVTTPSDYVLELERLHYSRTKPHVDWASGKYTKVLLNLLRDETLSFSSIAKQMNETFETNLFTRDMIAARSFFLRRLFTGRIDPWHRGKKWEA